MVGPQTWGMLTGGELSQEAASGTPTLQPLRAARTGEESITARDRSG
ncbi:MULTISPECIES: hypothetical protein [Streptomyces]|nr:MULTISPECIES: hypothetical protein [Streptomyces]MDI5903704.1 hypothetical protein [Streptomyces sp. 12257]